MSKLRKKTTEFPRVPMKIVLFVAWNEKRRRWELQIQRRAPAEPSVIGRNSTSSHRADQFDEVIQDGIKWVKDCCGNGFTFNVINRSIRSTSAAIKIDIVRS